MHRLPQKFEDTQVQGKGEHRSETKEEKTSSIYINHFRRAHKGFIHNLLLPQLLLLTQITKLHYLLFMQLIQQMRDGKCIQLYVYQLGGVYDASNGIISLVFFLLVYCLLVGDCQTQCTLGKKSNCPNQPDESMLHAKPYYLT